MPETIQGFEPLPPPAEIPEARASATILLARDRADGLELFMLERHVQSEFAGGAFVFPGGTLDEGDRDPALAGLVDGSDALAKEMGVDDPDLARALIVCAIRETFEEAGVLLARTTDGEPVQLDGPDWQARRSAVDAGEMTATELAGTANIRYAADQLRYWQRWVTPLHSPKRYDTFFFVAHMPEGQAPLHDAVETTDSAWISPREALGRDQNGTFSLVFPTRRTLESVEPHRTAEALWAAALGRPNEVVMPRLLVNGATMKIQVTPDGPLFDPW